MIEPQFRKTKYQNAVSIFWCQLQRISSDLLTLQNSDDPSRKETVSIGTETTFDLIDAASRRGRIEVPDVV
jgi:hypothetical protein